MKWWPKECEFGNIIRIKIGSVWHYGIFASENEVIQFGLPPVNLGGINAGEVRVVSTDIDVFASGRIVEKGVAEGKEKKKLRSPQKIVEAARARIGEGGYDLMNNNCEQFAFECAFGEHFSAQTKSTEDKWK
ncbi:MAG: lecithin retinol acyltransferase family protein [Clostridia bacterium]|nr:lecithin retinol acyltransferase family protein [Clostridia bacterium]